jgi:hypothetical protein
MWVATADGDAYLQKQLKRECRRKRIDEIWAVTQPFTHAVLYGRAFPPQWQDQMAENHERVRWFK